MPNGSSRDEQLADLRDLERERAKFKKEAEVLWEAVEEWRDLLNHSTGVDGLHLNNDPADWQWLIDNVWLTKTGALIEALEAEDK